MVYSIDYTHNGHMYPTQLMQIFSSASCVQQLIIPEWLNQIYIVAHRWKEKILSFPTMCPHFGLLLRNHQQMALHIYYARRFPKLVRS